MYIRKIRLAGLMAVCLLVGAAAMAAYEGLLSDRPSHRRGGHSSRRLTAELSRELHLTQEQKGRLEQILEESRQQIVELNRSMRPRFRQIREDTRKRIRGMLSAEQVGQFNRLVQKWDADRRRRRSTGKPDSAGGGRKPGGGS